MPNEDIFVFKWLSGPRSDEFSDPANANLPATMTPIN